MDFKIEFDKFLSEVEKNIQESLPLGQPNNLYEPFRYIMQEGGKRLRPVLAMICAGVVGANPYDATKCGAAIEILHNFTLVHDDIMDGSPLRRGRQTVHMKWNSDIAILTGDVMVGYAYKLLPKASEHSRSEQILNIFTNELIEVCEGQVLDMEFNDRKDVTMPEYINMIDKKTSRLIETACLIGAHIGYANDEKIAILNNIAHSAGLAFQIQDDLLDMVAEEKILGKKIGKDINEGKKTFLILAAKENAVEESDIKLIDEFYQNNGLPEQFIPQMDEMFRRTGTYEIASEQIRVYFEKAYSELNKLEENEYTKMLTWLINAIENRKF
ncbi:MAG: polyprenyl synthetase family protein [Ignavibacteriae bacterium HGW-Ignavibacteriae-1]|jgi:geranylgeranyl diphosphate synthase type II|nr:MAG: polyprenyl synthetase family protein [Ignavibacteriae bacterium HGW-Ignavibacteriae-1]